MAANISTTIEDARQALKILEAAGEKAMLAGGCVRDRLLNRQPKDFDIATTATPQLTTKVFKDQGYRVIPSGVEHGTVTVIMATGPIEITTLRRDVETDGRHAKVEFNGATFETDAARRDFTINSLFEDGAGLIHDFFGGKNDLRDRLLKFVGPPDQRIKEDYLRILRFFRFWARLGFKPDTSALDAISRNAAGLKNISQERITHELLEILQCQDAASALVAMINSGVMKLILPESASFTNSQTIVFIDASSMTEVQRPWVQLCTLLGLTQNKIWTKPQIQTLCRRLKLSDRQTRLLMEIIFGWQNLSELPRQIADALNFVSSIEHHGPDYNLINFFAPIWTFLARHSQDNQRGETVSWIVSMELTFGDRRREGLPLSGHDVSQVMPNLSGPEFGHIMTKLKFAYYNGDWRTREEGLRLLAVLRESDKSSLTNSTK